MTSSTSQSTAGSWRTGHWRWALAMMTVVAAVYGWMLVRPPSETAKRLAIDWCHRKYDSARTPAETLRVDALRLRGGRWNLPYGLCGDYRLTGMR